MTIGVIVLIAGYIVVGYCLTRTAWGRHVYAVGDDSDAARLAGLRPRRALTSAYLVAGLICAAA